MQTGAFQLSVNDVSTGTAIFRNDMPIWLGTFGSNIWPMISPTDPMYRGPTTSAIVWSDFIEGRGATLKNIHSVNKSKYLLCLTEQIVSDLKIAAAIYANFPRFLKHSRVSKSSIDPKTVKGRINELAKFLSLLIQVSKNEYGIEIKALNEISFQLLKECIPKYKGRSNHLKRALKLISDPMVQKNLSASLQWQLLDLDSKSIRWKATKDHIGIPTLSDNQFLFLMSHCRNTILEFKHVMGMHIHDKSFKPQNSYAGDNFFSAINSYFEYVSNQPNCYSFQTKFGYLPGEVLKYMLESHNSAMMIILLLTGMRETETKYFMRDSLVEEHGFSFIKSKVVKQKPQDIPVSEGWLAVDLTIDAYDILQYFSINNGNKYLFSPPFKFLSPNNSKGYQLGSLSKKFNNWIKRIDKKKNI